MGGDRRREPRWSLLDVIANAEPWDVEDEEESAVEASVGSTLHIDEP